MKNILLILLTTAFLFSCDESVDKIIYNGDETQNRTFLNFTATVVNLAVAIDDTGSIDMVLQSSTISSSERSFNIVLSTEETTANPLTYSLPASVVIPANSYEGGFSITGMDNNLLEPIPETIVFSLDGLPENVDMDTNKVIVNIFEFCPIPGDYMVGDYLIEDIVGIVGPGNGTENFAAGIVSISVNTESSRTFVAGVLPAFNGDETVIVNLICNSFVLQDVDPNLTCDGTNLYFFTNAGANNSTYSLTDDSVFIINYTEDPDGSCGGPFNSSFRLTKQ